MSIVKTVKTVKTVKIIEKNLAKRLKRIRKIISSSGTQIGSVHFQKRSNGALRKIAFRLHVRKPSIARVPKNNGNDVLERFKVVMKDRDNLQMTVLDVNKVVRNKGGEIIGRGAWRTIPLEGVKRIAVKGKVYVIGD